MTPEERAEAIRRLEHAIDAADAAADAIPAHPSGQAPVRRHANQCQCGLPRFELTPDVKVCPYCDSLNLWPFDHKAFYDQEGDE